MSKLFEVKEWDKKFYNEKIKEFIPGDIIDIHTHVYLEKFHSKNKKVDLRSAAWPALIAKDNSIEDLFATYELMFPEKRIKPLIFSAVGLEDDIDGANKYVQSCSREKDLPSLIYASPHWSAGELEKKILAGGFLGCKVYMDLAEPYIPRNEIRIFDFLPKSHLEVIDRHGWIVMLHIPRVKRLRDQVNLAQMMEIENKYRNVKLIIAHVGRAYCMEDIGEAFTVLSKTKNMMFDISANSNEFVFAKLIEAVGPQRILFGSDLPVLRMRAKRICEGGTYINLVPKGLYGDLTNENNMREISDLEAETITFFMYEEIYAFKKAADKTGLSKKDIEDVFYNNAKKLIEVR